MSRTFNLLDCSDYSNRFHVFCLEVTLEGLRIFSKSFLIGVVRVTLSK